MICEKDKKKENRFRFSFSDNTDYSLNDIEFQMDLPLPNLKKRFCFRDSRKKFYLDHL
jgi:hypothetical protein